MSSLPYPKPESEAPKVGTPYWVPSPNFTSEKKSLRYVWADDPSDYILLNAGLVHRNQESAETHHAWAKPGRYSPGRIAYELTEVALGKAYHGNALRAAKDFEFLDANDRSVLDRYATGADRYNTDHVALQDIARRIRALDE